METKKARQESSAHETDQPDNVEKTTPPEKPDVDEMSEESFPASDPPSTWAG